MAVSELEQRVADPLELIDLDVQFKLGSEQKLEFELVQFWKCQTSNLIEPDRKKNHVLKKRLVRIPASVFW